MKDPQSPRAEAYRHLRTNLRFVNVDNPTRVILVSSSLPAEGKSTTAVNLAVSLSEAGKRVLLIDADMRHPNLAEYLGLEGSVGLSDLLAGMVGTDDVLQRWGRHDLHVLTSGQVPPNPSELVGSANMAALLTEQRERFDFIVLDTPPLLPVTDAAALSPYVDGIVLVCRAAKTPGAGLARAVGNLRGVEARLLGCVLSMTREKRSGYGTYARDTRTPHRHSMGAVARVPLTAEVSLARQHGSAGRAERPVNAP
jgi:capsular exopolysaccharide synthesis family protein